MSATTTDNRWRWPRLRLGPSLAVVGATLLFGAFQGTTVLLSLRSDGSELPWSRPFCWELTGALAGAVCFVVPFTAALNAQGRGWRRFVALHAAGYVVFAAIKLPLMLGVRYAVYSIFGWERYQYSYWPGHVAMELMKDVVSYAVIVTACSLYLAARQRQAEALRNAALDAQLKEARLQALLGQVNPHFLMNALNTVSSVMFEDVARTDRLLSDLGLVLRAGFETDRPTWSLAEETAHTRRFAAILEARFADRLRIDWSIADDVAAAQVPRFALQLLVENAVKHNQDRAEPLALRIRARGVAGALQLEVEDTGRGFDAPSPARGAGVGLRHLEEVLRLLHGPRGRLSRERGAEGGACVRLTLPTDA